MTRKLITKARILSSKARYYFFIFFSFGNLWPEVTLALQKKTYQPHQTLTFRISPSHLNRIKVEEDRIIHLFGMEGDWYVETEEITGQVFICPGHHSSAPMALTLITEKGQSIDLKLLPVATFAETLLISLTKENSPAEEINQESQWARWIYAIDDSHLPQGFVKINTIRSETKEASLKIVRQAAYRKDSLNIQIYTLTNEGEETLTLKEEFLEGLEANPQALYLSTSKLLPGDTTRLYIVTHHHELKAEPTKLKQYLEKEERR